MVVACMAGVLLLVVPPMAFGQASDAPPDQRPTRTTVPVPEPSPESDGLLDEPSFITKGITLFDRRANRSREPKDGFYVELGNMITGAGWLSAGPGYRKYMFGDNAILSASGAVSVRLYRNAQASIEFPHVASDHMKFGAQTLFRDALQVNYFGLGNDSSESARSGYRLQTNDLTTYASIGARSLFLQARAGWLQPVTVSSMGREAGYPDTVALFTDRGAPGLSQQPAFLHGDVSLGVDTRDSVGHATRGGLYQATWSTFVDQNTGLNSFQRYEAEASQYVPLGTDNWILALHGATVLSAIRGRHEVPFYLMPNLGGRNDRGFADYRFHDRNMQAYSIESRWRVFAHLDAAAFVDAGSVSTTMRGLKFSDLKPSYGLGIRLHNDRVTMARLDFGHSVEGWHIYFRMNEPFRRTTQTNGYRPAAPYVP
jgi:surface antigen Omp85-like protein